MKIYIGADHRGKDYEGKIAEYLIGVGLDVQKCHIVSNDNDDYPDFAFDIGNKVVNEEKSLGILICGTGIGMSIAANKVKGVRAARCVDVNDAFYAKNHNDSNIICLGTENSFEKTCEIIDTFVNTKKASEERHIKRVNKIIDYEKAN